MAFTRQVRVSAWIDPAARRLVLDTGNATRADEVVTSLVKALDGFAVTLLNTRVEPAAAMSGWLDSQQPPAGFSIDRECELKAGDDSKAAVRYAKHPLDIEEVRQHIAAGKRATRLALTWEGRVSVRDVPLCERRASGMRLRHPQLRRLCRSSACVPDWGDPLRLHPPKCHVRDPYAPRRRQRAFGEIGGRAFGGCEGRAAQAKARPLNVLPRPI